MSGPAIAPIIEEGFSRAAKIESDTWLKSTVKFLQDIGMPAGDAIAKMMGAGTEAGDRTSGRIGKEVTNIFKDVPITEHKHIEDVALGKAVPKSATHAAKGQQFRALVDTFTNTAKIQGEKMPLMAGSSKRIGIALTSDGIHVYNPEIFKRGSEMRKDAITHLMKTGGYSQLEAATFIDNLRGQALGRRSLGHMYNPGFDLSDKFFAPTEMRYQMWSRAMGRTIAHNNIFGSSNENLIGPVRAIVNEKGDVTGKAVADALDVYFHQTFPLEYRTMVTGIPNKTYYASTTDLERASKTAAGYIFTRHIALPHISQILNAGLVTDISSVLKGTWERMFGDKQAAIDEVIHSGAAESEVFQNLLNHYYGRDTLFNKMFHQPLFSFERKIYTDISALAGKFHAQELFEDLTKDNEDKKAIEGLKKLGLDPEKLLSNGLTQSDKEKAMYTVAKEAMFKRDATQTPFRWEGGPMTRTAFMYKHFMFNQSRLVYNAFKQAYREEGAIGVLKTTAYLGTLYPAAGMLVQGAENLIMGKQFTDTDFKPTGNEYTDFYLNALAHAYSFGIAFGIYNSAKRRGLERWAIGPVFSKSLDFVQDLTNAGRDLLSGDKDFGDATKQVRRDILTSLPGGAFAERAVDDKLYEEK